MQYQALKDWTQAASEAGWLDSTQVERLAHLETQEAEALFISRGERPLLVALFGGTGAGKSSLINRLAGKAIARTGIERPTSYEITIYLHRDFSIQPPTELPLERTKIAWHQDDKRRLLAWIDMPDFDSTAQENRALVEAWLPYIDWVVYVVTPERYRDALGWSFLLERKQKHRWLFVMNHWDQGQQAQLEDLRQHLVAKGFENPDILRIACVQPPIADDFEQLETSINEAVHRFGLDWLQKQHLRARQDELLSLATEFGQALGSEADWARWREEARQGLETWLSGFRQAMHKEALRHISGLVDRKTELDDLPAKTSPLLDALLGPRIEEALEEAGRAWARAAFGLGLPTRALASLIPSGNHWAKQLELRLHEGLDAAFEKPGAPSQRRLRRLVGIAGWLLPVLAATWVGWELVQSYYLASRGQQDYAGINFAIHSGLLLGAAWFLPWVAARWLKPKPRQVLRQGIDQGLESFVAGCLAESQGLWDRLEKDRTHWRERLAKLEQSS